MTDGPKPLPTPDVRGSTPRVTLDQPAKLVGLLGRTIDVVLVDVSRDGFRVRADGPISGEQSFLRVGRHGDQRIELKWTRGHEAGGVFLDRASSVD